MFTSRVRAAQGDAWTALGVVHEPFGGGVIELPGVRLMASGLPHAQWNGGDVHHAASVDLQLVRGWYNDLAVPWGLRVPTDQSWPVGQLLFRQRLMWLEAASFSSAVTSSSLAIRPAGPGDVEIVLDLDASAFESDREASREAG